MDSKWAEAIASHCRKAPEAPASFWCGAGGVQDGDEELRSELKCASGYYVGQINSENDEGFGLLLGHPDGLDQDPSARIPLEPVTSMSRNSRSARNVDLGPPYP